MGAGGEALQKGVQRASAAIGERGRGNPLGRWPETKLSGGVGEDEPRGRKTLKQPCNSSAVVAGDLEKISRVHRWIDRTGEED